MYEGQGTRGRGHRKHAQREGDGQIQGRMEKESVDYMSQRDSTQGFREVNQKRKEAEGKIMI